MDRHGMEVFHMGLFIGLCVGWTIGGLLLWTYFKMNRLLRTRAEWYRDRKARGLSVPEDWKDNHEDLV